MDELERALAGDPTANPELLALVEDVRATAERPDPAFAARLDGLVAEGFGGAAAVRRRWTGFSLRPALAVAASVLLALVVAVPLIGGGEDEAADAPTSAVVESSGTVGDVDGGGSGEAASGLAAPQTGQEPAPVSPSPLQRSSAAPPVAADQALQTARDALGARRRQVERSAELELTAKPGDVQDVTDGVVRTTQAVGGYVARSEVATGDDGGGATFTLRIPASRLDEALRRLSKLAHVGSLRQSSTDITGPVSTASERVSDARAERKALLRALGRATSDAQIASLRARLRQNRSELAAAKGELQALRRRASLSTVAVTVASDPAAPQSDDEGAWTPADALGDAGRVLEVAAGVLLVAGAAMVPVGLLGALAWAGVRTTRRRRREAALDA